MIEFKFKLNKDTITATVPEHWGEVTLKQVLQLETEWTGESKDMIGLLSAFTGENFQTLENAKGNLWEPLFQVLSFVFNAPQWKKLKKPKTVTLGNKQVKPPTNLQLEAFGQKVMALQSITKEGSELDKIPQILAIYLQPAYDGKFVSDRIPDIKKLVMNMKAYEAMPFGIFFLKKLLRQRTFGRTGLRVSPRMLRNLQSIQRQVVRSSPNLATS
jgi:hypothetical protein